MGIEKWFEFRSSDDRNNDQNLYYQKIFKFGDDHRKSISRILKKTYPEHESRELLYFYILCKEKALNNESPHDAMMKISPRLSQSQQLKFAEILDLDLRSTSLEDVKAILK